jgi:hypothetical protein
MLQLRRQMKTVTEELERKQSELEQIKKQTKVTKYQELQVDIFARVGGTQQLSR